MMTPAHTLMGLTLAAGLIVSLQADAGGAIYDFNARYDILSPAGEKIGTYTSSVKGPYDTVYELSGQIEFSINRLGVFQQTYSSTDSVLYDANGIVRYGIVEINNGKRTEVTGVRSKDGAHLYLDSVPAQVSTIVIPRASYDYSLYAFRFPLPCARQVALGAREVKILTPRTGQVDTVRGEPAPVDTVITTAHGDAQCRLVTRDTLGKIVKESWFLQDGMLAFEKTNDFQLKLTQVHHGRRE